MINKPLKLNLLECYGDILLVETVEFNLMAMNKKLSEILVLFK